MGAHSSARGGEQAGAFEVLGGWGPAGMLAVGVTTLTPAEVLREAGAHWTLEDFGGLPEALERVLFGPVG